MNIKLGKTRSGQIEPLSRDALFSHCAGGMISVEESHYFDVVEPLLIIHGVDSFEYDWVIDSA